MTRITTYDTFGVRSLFTFVFICINCVLSLLFEREREREREREGGREGGMEGGREGEGGREREREREGERERGGEGGRERERERMSMNKPCQCSVMPSVSRSLMTRITTYDTFGDWSLLTFFFICIHCVLNYII